MKSTLTRLFLVALIAFMPQVGAFAQDLPDEQLREGRSSLEEGSPVRRLLLLRAGRFEVQPNFSFSMNDPFVNNLMAGLSANYYFTNSLGVGASFGFGVAGLDTDETQAVAGAGFSQFVKENLKVNELFLNFNLGIVYVPIFGKVSIFNWIVNYDLHLFAGVGGIMFEPRCADTNNAVCANDTRDNIGGFKIGGALGIGARLYFNNFIALNLEVHDYLLSYSAYQRDGRDAAEFQQFIVPMIGVSFFLPTDVLISR